MRVTESPSKAGAAVFIKFLCQLLYGGEQLTGDMGVFWFVTCLFLTQQIFNFVSIRVEKTNIILGISLALYGVAVLNQMSGESALLCWGFPWEINVVCCAFLFYAVGSIYGSYLFDRQIKVLLFLVIAISTLAVALTITGYNISFDMKHAYYGAFIVSPLVAFSMTKLCVQGSSFVSQNELIASALSSLGTASLTIMFLHRFIQFHSGDLCYRWH